MGLLTRLVAPLEGEDKLPVHQFCAALAEYLRGSVTGAQFATTFELSPTEITALQVFLDKLDDSSLTRQKIDDVLLLGEAKLYSLAKVQTELGL